MIVVLYSKDEIVVSAQIAKRIEELVQKDVKWIRLKGYLLRPSAIMMIKPGGFTEVDVEGGMKRLPRGDARNDPEMYQRARIKSDNVRTILQSKQKTTRVS